MNTAFDVLVIILSSLLAVFLVIAIMAAVLIYKLVKKVRRVVEKGEHLIDSAESAAEMFKTAAAPAGMMRSLFNIIDVVTKHKRKGE